MSKHFTLGLLKLVVFPHGIVDVIDSVENCMS